MYPPPHATQHLFIIQTVARFSSEQISWYDHFLIHTVLIFKNDSWILEAASSYNWGVCYRTCLFNNIKPFFCICFFPMQYCFIDISSWSSFKLEKHQTLWIHTVEEQKIVNGMCEMKLKEKVQRKGQLVGRSHSINALQNLQECLIQGIFIMEIRWSW